LVFLLCVEENKTFTFLAKFLQIRDWLPIGQFQ
jgi:hypothetical protein